MDEQGFTLIELISRNQIRTRHPCRLAITDVKGSNSPGMLDTPLPDGVTVTGSLGGYNTGEAATCIIKDDHGNQVEAQIMITGIGRWPP